MHADLPALSGRLAFALLSRLPSVRLCRLVVGDGVYEVEFEKCTPGLNQLEKLLDQVQ
jgi:hypothetical protein